MARASGEGAQMELRFHPDTAEVTQFSASNSNAGSDSLITIVEGDVMNAPAARGHGRQVADIGAREEAVFPVGDAAEARRWTAWLEDEEGQPHPPRRELGPRVDLVRQGPESLHPHS